MDTYCPLLWKAEKVRAETLRGGRFLQAASCFLVAPGSPGSPGLGAHLSSLLPVSRGLLLLSSYQDVPLHFQAHPHQMTLS